MKTWVNCTLGVKLCDEIKRKNDDKEWIITKIDYPSDKPGKIFIYAMTKDGETMQTLFNSDEWLKSEINYLNAFMMLMSNIDQIETEHIEFFKEK